VSVKRDGVLKKGNEAPENRRRFLFFFAMYCMNRSLILSILVSTTSSFVSTTSISVSSFLIGCICRHLSVRRFFQRSVRDEADRCGVVFSKGFLCRE
jgi:hypothetical protein